jgi:antitoxin YefM
LKSRANGAVPTPRRKRLMNTISVTDARNRLPELVDDVAGHLNEYVITRHGRAHAVLLAADEHEALIETLDILSDSRAVERIRKGLEELANGDVVSFEDAFGEPL